MLWMNYPIIRFIAALHKCNKYYHAHWKQVKRSANITVHCFMGKGGALGLQNRRSYFKQKPFPSCAKFSSTTLSMFNTPCGEKKACLQNLFFIIIAWLIRGWGTFSQKLYINKNVQQSAVVGILPPVVLTLPATYN